MTHAGALSVVLSDAILDHDFGSTGSSLRNPGLLTGTLPARGVTADCLQATLVGDRVTKSATLQYLVLQGRLRNLGSVPSNRSG